MHASGDDGTGQATLYLQEYVYRWFHQNDFADVASLFAQEVSLPLDVQGRPFLEVRAPWAMRALRTARHAFG